MDILWGKMFLLEYGYFVGKYLDTLWGKMFLLNMDTLWGNIYGHFVGHLPAVFEQEIVNPIVI